MPVQTLWWAEDCLCTQVPWVTDLLNPACSETLAVFHGRHDRGHHCKLFTFISLTQIRPCSGGPGRAYWSPMPEPLANGPMVKSLSVSQMLMDIVTKKSPAKPKDLFTVLRDRCVIVINRIHSFFEGLRKRSTPIFPTQKTVKRYSFRRASAR